MLHSISEGIQGAFIESSFASHKSVKEVWVILYMVRAKVVASLNAWQWKSNIRQKGEFMTYGSSFKSSMQINFFHKWHCSYCMVLLLLLLAIMMNVNHFNVCVLLLDWMSWISASITIVKWYSKKFVFFFSNFHTQHMILETIAGSLFGFLANLDFLYFRSNKMPQKVVQRLDFFLSGCRKHFSSDRIPDSGLKNSLYKLMFKLHCHVQIGKYNFSFGSSLFFSHFIVSLLYIKVCTWKPILENIHMYVYPKISG